MKSSMDTLWIIVFIAFNIICPVHSIEFKLVSKLMLSIEEKSFMQVFSSIYRAPLSSDFSSKASLQLPHLNSSSIDSSSQESGEVPSQSSVSCAYHLQSIAEKFRLNLQEIPILNLIGSFAKPTFGIRFGNLDWSGDRSQCESTEIFLKLNATNTIPDFYGKYCRAKWRTYFDSNYSLTHYTGVCVPSSCGIEDFVHLKKFLEKFSFLKMLNQSHVMEVDCHRQDSVAIDSMIFYSLCSAIMVIGLLGTFSSKFSRKLMTISQGKSGNKEYPILSAFDISRNWKSLSGEIVSKNDILMIHYLRSITTMFPILVHAGLALSLNLVPNPDYFTGLLNMIKLLLPFFPSMITVFFFLSSFLIHSDYVSSDQRFNPFRSVFKAYIRLAPAYYFTLFTQAAYLSKLGFGEEMNFGWYSSNRSICSGFQLDTLLFTHNSAPSISMCNPGFWSMAVTFQAHITCVFVVWLLLSSKLSGFSLIASLMLYCSATSLKILNNLKIEYIIEPTELNSAKDILNLGRNVETFFDEFYYKTVSWSCPILMGIVFAYILPHIQRISHLSQKIIVFIATGLVISLYSFLIILTGLGNNQKAFSLIIFLSPFGTSLIVSILLFIFHPKSQFISYKLSLQTAPILVHLSKLSYSLYLTHWTVFIAVLNTVRLTPTPDFFTTLCLLSGCFFIVYVASIWLYIFVEKPCQNIRKIFNM